MDSVRALILPTSRQSLADRRLAYQAMATLAGLLLSHARSVILDATFAPDEVRQLLARLAADAGVGVHWIECRVSPELAASRFLARPEGHPALDLNESRVRRLATTHPYLGKGLEVDSSQPVSVLLPTIMRYVKRTAPIHPKLLLPSGMAQAG